MGRLRRRAVALIRPDRDVSGLFCSIEDELGPYRYLLKGKVLNAGAGERDISHLVNGELVNQDIPHGPHDLKPGSIDIWAPLEDIPIEDDHFDVVICNAVLEHVEDPERVMGELARVLKPGGTLYLGVPFMQPEHLGPIDGQRYTLGGLGHLCARHGFEVREGDTVHSVDTTLGWIVNEWLQEEHRPVRLLFGRLWYEALKRSALKTGQQVSAIASAYRVIAVKR